MWVTLRYCCFQAEAAVRLAASERGTVRSSDEGVAGSGADPLRRSVRTEASGPSDADARTLVLAFVDLPFADGHVERWLGPGSIAGFPSGARALQRLQEWAEEVASDQLPCLGDEVAMGFTDG
jgi:hypothetical protein